MKIFSQTNVVLFLIFTFFFFISSEHYGLCYASEKNYLRPIVTSFVNENKGFTAQEKNDNSNNNTRNNNNNSKIVYFNVLKHGAKGDGATNDDKAFSETWKEACKVNGGVILVPAGYTFLLQPVIFDGSNCKSNPGFQIDGRIVAPDISSWAKTDFQWILFINNRKGLMIKGKGSIDGRGAPWWNTSRFRPHALRIADSSNVVVTGITVQNPPQMHLFIDNGQYIQVYNFKSSAPAESPNTDGIHLSNCQHAVIHNNTLACGDDCVSIQKGCSDIKVYNVNCGPGHGYSIGGLGSNFAEAQVSDISVFDSKVQNSLTGVRIKTWPGGLGSVTKVRFSNIQMSNVRTSVVIDQFYCGGPKTCNIKSRNAIQISNVTFEKLTGSYTYKPISLLCSPYKPCRSLRASVINLVPSNPSLGPAQAECSNAQGQVLTPTTPPLNNCLMGPSEVVWVPADSPEDSPAPAN